MQLSIIYRPSSLLVWTALTETDGRLRNKTPAAVSSRAAACLADAAWLENVRHQERQFRKLKRCLDRDALDCAADEVAAARGTQSIREAGRHGTLS